MAGYPERSQSIALAMLKAAHPAAMRIETVSQKLGLTTQNYCKHTESDKRRNYFSRYIAPLNFSIFLCKMIQIP